MYLAPLNYDRYFKKVFSDERIAQQFLEDFLGVQITSIERLSTQQRVTDEAAIVEFDYRCKIDGAYVIIDMQQWYKPDIIQRFYLYHALNTGLQLENLPKDSLFFDYRTQKMKRTRDYRRLEPVLTLIWLVDDTLFFKEDYIAYTMAPELVLEFIENEALWRGSTILDLQKERQKIIAVTKNRSKNLTFLRHNRLIFMLQQNIVKQKEGQLYERWFRFAEKSRQAGNESSDFKEFQGDDIFEEMMRRLRKESLTEDDITYIATEQEMWEKFTDLEGRHYETGFQDGQWKGVEEGRAEGIEEGEQRKAREIATKFLDIVDDQTIAKKTGLSIAEVQQLRLTAAS